MGGLSRAQLAVSAAIGVVLLLLGIGAVRGAGASTEAQRTRLATAPVGSGGAGDGTAGDVVVHVAGAVRKPGVYHLPAGARVNDAINRAGGTAPEAVPDGLNLAARLADGQQVAVPAKGEPAVGSAHAEGPISLGGAEAADLEEIDGIGPVTAEKIIAFRDEHGGVASVDELDAVPGIGPATLEALADRLQP
jgi:competence protein ComEA